RPPWWSCRTRPRLLPPASPLSLLDQSGDELLYRCDRRGLRRIVDRRPGMALGLGKRLVPRDRGDHVQPTSFTNQIGVAGIADLVGDAHDPGGPRPAPCPIGESTGCQESIGRRLDDDDEGVCVVTPAGEGLASAPR